MSDERQQPDRSADGEPRPRSRTAAEWVVFAVCSAMIVAVAAVLLGVWLLGPSAQPSFDVSREAVRRVGDHYHVPVTVENVGDEAAASVRVHAEVELGSERIESDQTIDFLAPGAQTQLTFVFARDPRRGELSVQVHGFQEP